MINYRINKYDLNDLERILEDSPKKLRRKWIRESTRHAQRRHILPQVKRMTPSGGKGAKGLHINKAGERNNRAFQAYAYTGGRSKGNLRRSWKIQALKRSQRISGTAVATYDPKTFYGKFLELGRTHNEFLPMRLWKNFPEERKRKIKGRHMWLRVSKRRGPIAQRAAIREIWRRMREYYRSNQ